MPPIVRGSWLQYKCPFRPFMHDKGQFATAAVGNENRKGAVFSKNKGKLKFNIIENEGRGWD